jgi:hypothetical protein
MEKEKTEVKSSVDTDRTTPVAETAQTLAASITVPHYLTEASVDRRVRSRINHNSCRCLGGNAW